MPGHWRRACVAVIALALAGCGGGDELMTIDRVGKPDAPKVLKLQINASYSPQASTPSIAEGFRRLFLDWARRHPEWRLDLNIIGGNMTTTEQARLLEKAKVATAPDCANVDSFTIPLFIEQGVLQPLDEHFHRSPTRRPVPERPRGDDRARRADLRVVGVDRPPRRPPPDTCCGRRRGGGAS